MAIKLGAENRRNVIIAAVLFCIVAYLAISQLTGGPAAPPKPVTAPPRQATQTVNPAAGSARVSGSPGASSPAAHQLPATGLDPTLHLEKLAASESIEYAGDGRNIFSAESAPVHIETAIGPARPTGPIRPVGPVVPAVPQPPPIDLHYFGYAALKDGKREAFLLHGDDIFTALPGEIVNHRYKVVAVDLHSVRVTDLSYNNTQTLQLTN